VEGDVTATKPSTETTDRHLDSDLGSVAAVLLVVIAAVVVALGYRQHVADVSQLNDRAPSLDYLGSSSISRTWTPIPDTLDTLVAIDLRRADGDTSDFRASIATALANEGFGAEPSFELARSNGEGGKGWRGRDVATIEMLSDDHAIVHLTVRPWTKRSTFPLWVFAATIAFGAAAIVATSPMRARLARGLLGLAAIQALLLIRALWIAKTRIDTYVADFGPIESVFEAGNEALKMLRFEVSSVTAGLYPFGAATILALAPAWGVATALGFRSTRSRLIAMAAGLLVAASVMLYFGSISGTIINMLD